MKKEDIEFLKGLQNELLSQDNEYNENPVIWSVMETTDKVVPNGYGDYSIAVIDGERYTKDELIKWIDVLINEIDDEVLKNDVLVEWDKTNKNDMDSIIDFGNFNFFNYDAEIFDCIKVDKISEIANAFITKRECIDYIDEFGYKHKNPKAYSTYCNRNYELGKLLDIIKKIDFNDINID